MYDNALLWVSLMVLATAVQPILVKLGYRTQLDAAQLLLVKNLLSALIVLPAWRYFRWLKLQEAYHIGRISLLILGVNGFSLLALERLPAAVVVTLTTTVPLLVGSVNSLLGRERLKPRFWLGVSLAFMGVLLVTQILWAWGKGWEEALNLWGLLACAGAIACAVTYRVNMQVLTHRFEPHLLWIWAFWINALAVGLVLTPWTPLPPTSDWPLALGVGLSAAIANSAFIWSIRLVGATSTSSFQLLQRPLIILSTALILGESLTPSQWLGALLVVAGVPLAQASRPKSPEPPKSPEAPPLEPGN